MEIYKEAKKCLGTKCVIGGSNPDEGFDCSGFVQYIFKTQGINIPRTTYQQYEISKSVDLFDAEAGDLIFSMDKNHVGIYIGNYLYIHAPKAGDKVRINSLIINSEMVSLRRIEIKKSIPKITIINTNGKEKGIWDYKITYRNNPIETLGNICGKLDDAINYVLENEDISFASEIIIKEKEKKSTLIQSNDIIKDRIEELIEELKEQIGEDIELYTKAHLIYKQGISLSKFDELSSEDKYFYIASLIYCKEEETKNQIALAKYIKENNKTENNTIYTIKLSDIKTANFDQILKYLKEYQNKSR